MSSNTEVTKELIFFFVRVGDFFRMNIAKVLGAGSVGLARFVHFLLTEILLYIYVN